MRMPLFVLLAALTGAPACLAADLPVADLPDVNIVSTKDLRLERAGWTGFSGVIFAGMGVVQGSDNINWDVVMHSGVVGASAGYDRQVGRLVLGGHVEGYFSNFQKTSKSGTVRQKAEWIAAATARLGYDAGRFMPYVSAGVGATRYKFDQTRIEHLEAAVDDSEFGVLAHDRVLNLSDTNILYGLVLGGGVEGKVTRNIFFRADYKHFHFNKMQYQFRDAKPFMASARADIVDLGIGYRF